MTEYTDPQQGITVSRPKNMLIKDTAKQLRQMADDMEERHSNVWDWGAYDRGEYDDLVFTCGGKEIGRAGKRRAS